MRSQILSIFFALAVSASAVADQGQQSGTGPIALPLVEVGAGYAYTVQEVTNPCRGDCVGSARDTRGSGAMISIGVEGLRISDLLTGGPGVYDVRFLPLYMIVDADAPGYGDSFGRVSGFGAETHIRRFIGALVQGNYNPRNGLVSLRGKLVSVDYNRDRGTWDWRALDASVGLRGVFGSADGHLRANLEISVGAGIGGIHLNNLEQVAALIAATGTRNHSMTANPFVAARAGLRVGGFRVELVGQAERRVDLTAAVDGPGYYMSRPLTVDSDRVSVGLDAEWVFLGGPQGFDSAGPGLAAFLSSAYEYDTLTFTNMFTGSGDDFHQFRIVAGLRGRF
jgi:hypothetical protein